MKTDFKMFCYRYWLESRIRLLIALVLLILILLQALNQAGATIKNHPQLFGGRELLFTQYVWVIIYKGYFLTIFTVASFLMGVGSPVQERASGTVLFSLSLPVPRKLLIYSKLLTASVLVIGLSLFMGFLIPLLSGMFAFHYPLQDALLFSTLIATGGIVFMLFGFILSLFITKETIIIPLGMAVMSALFFITKMPALKHLNIFNFMVGAGYLSDTDFLFNQPINTPVIALIGLIVFLIAIGLGSVFKQMDI
jgi:ABC-type transport system involved in multi-copper enzyme maturation permease subunit